MKTFVKLMIDVSKAPDAELIPMTQAAKLVPGRRGGNINLGTLQRYANPEEGRSCGAPGFARVHVVLPSILRSYTRYTTRAAVQLWMDKCREIDNRPRPRPGRTDKQAEAATRRAIKELKKMGMAKTLDDDGNPLPETL